MLNCISSLFVTGTKDKIAVLMFAFLKKTGDAQETPAMAFLFDMLLQVGAVVSVYNVKVRRGFGHLLQVS